MPKPSTSRENGHQGGRPKGSLSAHNKKAIKVKVYFIGKLLGEKQARKITVVDKLFTLAEAGDMKAIKEVLDRCLGRPSLSVDLTSGGEEITPGKVLNVDLGGMTVEQLKKLLAQRNQDR